jgi:hypothetical protein
MAIHTKLLGNELQKKGEKNQDTNLKNESFKLTTIFFILEVSLVRLQKLSILILKIKKNVFGFVLFIVWSFSCSKNRGDIAES